MRQRNPPYRLVGQEHSQNTRDSAVQLTGSRAMPISQRWYGCLHDRSCTSTKL